MWLTGGDHFTLIKRGDSKDMIFAVLDKVLFKQKILLLCSMKREAIDDLNMMAENESQGLGISANILSEIALPPIILQDTTHTQEPAELLKEFERKKKEAEEARTHRKEKADFVDSQVVNVQPDEQFFYGPFWRLCDYSNDKIFCVKCRTDERARATNTENQCTCIHCSANSYAPQSRYNVESQREARLEMGARIKIALKESMMDQINIKEDITGWLVTLADCMIGNKSYQKGEKFMKAVSHFGEVRIPPHMAEELCNSGKMRRCNIIIEKLYNDATDETESYFRIGKDFGNVAYPDYVKRLFASRGDLDSMMSRIFEWSKASAEKLGDVMEMWLGVLDTAAMTYPQLQILSTCGCKEQTEVWSILNGLERAFPSFMGTAVYTTTPNDKRRGSWNIYPDERERFMISTILKSVDRYAMSMSGASNRRLISSWRMRRRSRKRAREGRKLMHRIANPHHVNQTYLSFRCRRIRVHHLKRILFHFVTRWCSTASVGCLMQLVNITSVYYVE